MEGQRTGEPEGENTSAGSCLFLASHGRFAAAGRHGSTLNFSGSQVLWGESFSSFPRTVFWSCPGTVARPGQGLYFGIQPSQAFIGIGSPA